MGNKTCAKCWQTLNKMPKQLKINSAIAEAIRAAKILKNANSSSSEAPYPYLQNDERPDKAFKTERAKKDGKANASSGQIFVTIAPDHFGPILAEHDPKRNTGIRVGEIWEERFECRQWGAHFPHIAGIAGQSRYGAQSVVLSGGYEDDEDHGDWFLYTGSGGRDLTKNKRTNNEQSFDQKFEKLNAALRTSCLRGYPVRVVRSHKESSSYAPGYSLRYDGIYRIERCWRKVSIQGKFKVCRFLFVRCDNEPAPWTSDEHGDCPQPLPDIKELKDVATEITERKEPPAWEYDNEGWKWMVSPPTSQKRVSSTKPRTRKEDQSGRKCVKMSDTEKLLKELGCSICNNVIKEPVSTPCCGDNFCKTCLIGLYDCESSTREWSGGGRALRAKKIVKKCPSCLCDICDFLMNVQINRELMDAIQSLQQKLVEEGKPKEVKKEERDNAENNETQGSIDEQSPDPTTLKVDAENGNNDMMKMGMTHGEVLVHVEDMNVIVESMENANEEMQQSLKRKADCEIDDAHDAKRMKIIDAM